METESVRCDIGNRYVEKTGKRENGQMRRTYKMGSVGMSELQRVSAIKRQKMPCKNPI